MLLSIEKGDRYLNPASLFFTKTFQKSVTRVLFQAGIYIYFH